MLTCVETTNEKKKKGLFGGLLGGDPDPVHYTAALLTPNRLIWVRSGAKSGVVVSGARLNEIEVKDFDSSLIQDTGLDVFGFVNQSPERVSAFIGLGTEGRAGRFRDAVKEAVARARGGK